MKKKNPSAQLSHSADFFKFIDDFDLYAVKHLFVCHCVFANILSNFQDDATLKCRPAMRLYAHKGKDAYSVCAFWINKFSQQLELNGAFKAAILSS